ncbi:aromatic alcohol reductase [Aspergillus lucknowensis]|uniref:NmrA-like domain-containing protein n=1 Tax=Aspergillus lucknowensis TaxID=176173 RepID=A0ABR4LE65_9EURO
MTTRNILVLGAGELGTQVLVSLAQHPNRNITTSTLISALLRPTTLTSTNPQKTKELDLLREHGITLIPGDITNDPIPTLVSIFSNYDTIISCTGFTAGPGTQLKVAQAVLAAKVQRYIPWQFGVDYDVIGRGSGQDLFDEQLDVRDLLRSQETTKWVIISTGMFTSFLFEESFGVVDFANGVVTALGSWGNRVTVTSPEDIGRVTAEVVLGSHSHSEDEEEQDAFGDKPIFIAGDTLSYAQLAELVERVTGRQFERRLRTVQAAREDLAKDPGNALFKYEIVFGEGRGVAWDVNETWNYQQGMKAQTAEEWAREHLDIRAK